MKKIINYHLSKSRALAPAHGHNCGGLSKIADASTTASLMGGRESGARNTTALCENRARVSLASVWARLTLECFDCLTKGWKDNCVMVRPINANLMKPIEEFGPSAGNDHGDPALCQHLIQIAEGV